MRYLYPKHKSTRGMPISGCLPLLVSRPLPAHPIYVTAHDRSAIQSITGATVYGQNSPTATAGKYLRAPPRQSWCTTTPSSRCARGETHIIIVPPIRLAGLAKFAGAAPAVVYALTRLAAVRCSCGRARAEKRGVERASGDIGFAALDLQRGTRA